MIFSKSVENSQTIPEQQVPTLNDSELRSLDDYALMERVQSGSIGAFEVIYQRYAPLLLGVGTQLLRDKFEAEDIVHDVFFYVFRRSHIFNAAKGNVRSWLVQVTYSRAFNRVKWRRLHGSNEESSRRIVSDLINETMNDPEQLTELSFWRDILFQAMQTLSNEQRTTLKLFYFGGYTLEEISRIMTRPLGNVRHYYYRGLCRLRQSVISRSGRVHCIKASAIRRHSSHPKSFK